MNHEPTLTIPVIAAGSTKRRQFLTTLSLKTICMLVDPILQRKTQAAGLPPPSLNAPQIAATWKQRGGIESIKPIVIAIDQGCLFKALDESLNVGIGILECPLSAIVDVCDGMQRIAALHLIALKTTDLTANEWPVQLIETNGKDDLASLVTIIQNQANGSMQGQQSKQAAAKSREWSGLVIAECRFLRLAVAATKSTLSTRSSHLWTGSAITVALTRAFESLLPHATPDQVVNLAGLWDRLPASIPALGDYVEGRTVASRLREETILPQAPTVHALAIVLAHVLLSESPLQDAILRQLGTFNWSTPKQVNESVSRIQQREDRTQLLLNHCGLKPKTLCP